MGERRQRLADEATWRIARDAKLSGLIIFTGTEFSKPPPSIDLKKNPQFLTYPSTLTA